MLTSVLEIVTPDWLVKSVEAGALLPWKDFIFRPDDRADEIQGTKRTQKSLFDGFVSQTKPRTSTNPPSDESPTDKPKTSTNTLDTSDASIEVPVQQETESAQSSSESPQSALNLLTGPKRSPSKYQAIYMTDPATKEQAARIPGYAADKSNLAAQRVMANPEWRSAHTSVAPDFIEGYYKNSRLHYLATWKAELKNLVSEAQDRAEGGAAEVIKVDAESNLDDRVVDGVSMRGTGLNMKSPKAKGKQKAEAEEKIIMHCDFDSFFVSAGLVDRPHLRGKPVVVCHSQGTQGGSSSTSEIASSSYEARKSGIKNGMRCGNHCPAVSGFPD
jgi:DNA repair protein REV1